MVTAANEKAPPIKPWCGGLLNISGVLETVVTRAISQNFAEQMPDLSIFYKNNAFVEIFMAAQGDLINWNSRWQISGGVVSCRSCRSQQLEHERSEPFLHASNC